MLEFLLAVFGQGLLMALIPLMLLFFLRNRPIKQMALPVLGTQAAILLGRYGLTPIYWHMQWGDTLPQAVLHGLTWYNGDGVMALFPAFMAGTFTVLALMLDIARRKTKELYE